MIRKLYETHIEVSDLARSIEFYRGLGLDLAYEVPSRKVAFFWIGEPGAHMLGVWEVTEGRPPARRHFAFGVDEEDIRHAREWLAERGIETRNAFGKDGSEPMVHSWMPAAAIYFDDPDGNSLEFLCMLPHDPRELPQTLHLSEWEQLVLAPPD